MRGALRSGGAAGLSDEASCVRERLSASQRKQLSGRAEAIGWRGQCTAPAAERGASPQPSLLARLR
jgi:hypothetical protein